MWNVSKPHKHVLFGWFLCGWFKHDFMMMPNSMNNAVVDEIVLSAKCVNEWVPINAHVYPFYAHKSGIYLYAKCKRNHRKINIFMYFRFLFPLPSPCVEYSRARENIIMNKLGKAMRKFIKNSLHLRREIWMLFRCNGTEKTKRKTNVFTLPSTSIQKKFVRLK